MKPRILGSTFGEDMRRRSSFSNIDSSNPVVRAGGGERETAKVSNSVFQFHLNSNEETWRYWCLDGKEGSEGASKAYILIRLVRWC